MPEDHREMCCVTLVRHIQTPQLSFYPAWPGLNSLPTPRAELRMSQFWHILASVIQWTHNHSLWVRISKLELTLQAAECTPWGATSTEDVPFVLWPRKLRGCGHTVIRNWVGLAGDLTWLSIFASLVFRKWAVYWTLQWLLGERRRHLPHDGPHGSHPDGAWRWSAAER